MELYATGFNAWSQLRFDGTMTTEPEDLSSFTCVLQDEAISGLLPCLSYTLGRYVALRGIHDEPIPTFGVLGRRSNGSYFTDCIYPLQVTTTAGLRSAGLIPKEDATLHRGNERAYLTIAEAANGTVAAYDGSGNIHQYASMADLVTGRKQFIYSGFPSLDSLVAYDAGFAALSATGRVWTWGDERYAACLGREVTDACPAAKPREVADLKELPTGPVTRLAAGGYLLAALTSGHDLYVWGGHPGRRAILEGISGQPSPTLIDEHDIVDVGVGDSHLIALVSGGQAFVIGDNSNGQLGLDVESVASWTSVPLELGEGQYITGVAAGPKNSFLIVGTK